MEGGQNLCAECQPCEGGGRYVVLAEPGVDGGRCSGVGNESSPLVCLCWVLTEANGVAQTGDKNPPNWVGSPESLVLTGAAGHDLRNKF